MSDFRITLVTRERADETYDVCVLVDGQAYDVRHHLSEQQVEALTEFLHDLSL